MVTRESSDRADESASRREEPIFVRKTVYNEATQQYEERSVPASKYEIEDMELQRQSWRESVERASVFQDNLTQQFRQTLKSARTTYRLLTAMSVALFVTGLALFVFAALYGTFADQKVYSLVFAGLGASTFVALFILRPFEDAQIALSDMVQAEMGLCRSSSRSVCGRTIPGQAATWTLQRPRRQARCSTSALRRRWQTSSAMWSPSTSR